MAFSPLQIYLLSNRNKDCLILGKEDRVGVAFRETPWPVSYQFTNDAINIYNSEFPDTIGVRRKFDDLPFPYSFFVSAYLDTSKWQISHFDIAYFWY